MCAPDETMRLWSGYARHIVLVTGLFPLALNNLQRGQLVDAHGGEGYAPILNRESGGSCRPAVVGEWGARGRNPRNNLWPAFCADPTGMEEAVVCSSQRSSDGRPGRVGVLQK